LWRTQLFLTVLNVIGVVSGLAIVGVQLTVAPSMQTLFDILLAFPLLFWGWMLWAGVLCWRRTPRHDRVGPVGGAGRSPG